MMAGIYVKFVASGISKKRIEERGLSWVRDDEDGVVVSMGVSNSYSGDDESIVYGVSCYPGVDGLGEYKILWDESDY